MEFSLLWAALTAVSAGYLGLRLWGDHLPDSAPDQLITATVTGLATGRLTAMLSQGINPLSNPGDVIIVRGGVSSLGASVGFIATLLWLNRNRLTAIDALAPSILAALAGWHAGCLWRSACLGTQSDLPWAWSLTTDGVTRHPVELYTALVLAGAAVAVARLPFHAGLRSGAALFAISSARLLTEPLRPSITGGPVLLYVLGAAVGLLLMGWSSARARGSPRAANLSNR